MDPEEIKVHVEQMLEQRIIVALRFCKQTPESTLVQEFNGIVSDLKIGVWNPRFPFGFGIYYDVHRIGYGQCIVQHNQIVQEITGLIDNVMVYYIQPTLELATTFVTLLTVARQLDHFLSTQTDNIKMYTYQCLIQQLLVLSAVEGYSGTVIFPLLISLNQNQRIMTITVAYNLGLLSIDEVGTWLINNLRGKDSANSVYQSIKADRDLRSVVFTDVMPAWPVPWCTLDTLLSATNSLRYDITLFTRQPAYSIPMECPPSISHFLHRALHIFTYPDLVYRHTDPSAINVEFIDMLLSNICCVQEWMLHVQRMLDGMNGHGWRIHVSHLLSRSVVIGKYPLLAPSYAMHCDRTVLAHQLLRLDLENRPLRLMLGEYGLLWRCLMDEQQYHLLTDDRKELIRREVRYALQSKQQAEFIEAIRAQSGPSQFGWLACMRDMLSVDRELVSFIAELGLRLDLVDNQSRTLRSFLYVNTGDEDVAPDWSMFKRVQRSSCYGFSDGQGDRYSREERVRDFKTGEERRHRSEKNMYSHKSNSGRYQRDRVKNVRGSQKYKDNDSSAR